MRYLSSAQIFLPVVVAVLLGASLLTSSHMPALLAIAVGVAIVCAVSYREIRQGRFSLDYIAFLAMVVALVTREYIAGGVIAFMYVGGEALEAYASHRARSALEALLHRLPKTVLVEENGTTVETLLSEVRTGSVIIVRHGELVPLDGILLSQSATLTLANLTGEPLPQTIRAGAVIKSGSVNEGEAIRLTTTGILATSTYAKIIDLVRTAHEHDAPLVRLAERANLPFTLLTLAIAGGTYLFSHDITRVLAVLVIATPCPLIIAAPVAFIGGVSRAARKNIIVKTPAALETLARATTLFFDKTGTLTLGVPQLTNIVLLRSGTEDTALARAAALEYHSIHPLAGAVVRAARSAELPLTPASEVKEELGRGIEGTVKGRRYRLAHANPEARTAHRITLTLFEEEQPYAHFHFADVLKPDARNLLSDLIASGLTIAIVTGDTAVNAKEMFRGTGVRIYAECTPEKKYTIVDEARARGDIVAMIGDGLNDAPALARADVGVVFSGTENSASIEAADVAILDRSTACIRELQALSLRSVRIARQSIYTGIGLSVVGMLCASLGAIPPVTGAILQELIDVSVILNALRATFEPRTEALTHTARS